MTKTKFLIAVAIAAVMTSNSNAADYTIADVKALASTNSWTELLDKAKEVKPSERTPEWKDLVTRAAESDVNALDSKDANSGKRIRTLLDTYPFIVENTGINTKVTSIVLDNLNVCLAGYEIAQCQADFMSLLKKNPGLRDLPLKGAKVMSGRLNRNALAPYFEIAVKADKNSCKDADLEKAIIAGLQLPSKEESAISAKNIAAACSTELNPKLEAQYNAELKGSFYRQNTCQALKRSCD